MKNVSLFEMPLSYSLFKNKAIAKSELSVKLAQFTIFSPKNPNNCTLRGIPG